MLSFFDLFFRTSFSVDDLETPLVAFVITITMFARLKPLTSRP